MCQDANFWHADVSSRAGAKYESSEHALENAQGRHATPKQRSAKVAQEHCPDTQVQATLVTEQSMRPLAVANATRIL